MSDALTKIRQTALQLPETAERLSHGQPTFFVAGKQFAQFRDNHHGDSRTVICVRTSGLDEQAMLLESDPQALRAISVLPDAKRLAESVRNGTPISLNFPPAPRSMPDVPEMEEPNEILV